MRKVCPTYLISLVVLLIYLNLSIDHSFHYLKLTKKKKFSIHRNTDSEYFHLYLQRFFILLIILLMSIQIAVYLNFDAYCNGKWVYKRDVEQNDSLNFPYTQIESSMRILYGNACVVQFLSISSDSCLKTH